MEIKYPPRFGIPKHKDTIPKEIAGLAVAISELPAELCAKIEPKLNHVVESTKRRRRIFQLVQDALSQLRLDMKYLMFDLEATRRERDALQKKLNSLEGKE